MAVHYNPTSQIADLSPSGRQPSGAHQGAPNPFRTGARKGREFAVGAEINLPVKLFRSGDVAEVVAIGVDIVAVDLSQVVERAE